MEKPWLKNRGKFKKKKKKKGADDAPVFGLPMPVEPDVEYVACEVPNKTLLLYDPYMKKHANPVMLSHPESPERIARIFSSLESAGVAARCIQPSPKPSPVPANAANDEAGSAHADADATASAAAESSKPETPSGSVYDPRFLTDEEILLAHKPEYLEWIHKVEAMGLEDRIALAKTLNSVFLNEHSVDVARFAAKTGADLVTAVLRGEAQNGIAVLRPPGHHVESNRCIGFGLLNNIAIAARIAQRDFPGTRVMIVDWDIHHGNGTQDIFLDDNSVLFFSVHGHLNGKYFPKGDAGSPASVGVGAGAGFNVNVGWDKLGREDCDYLAVFNQVQMTCE